MLFFAVLTIADDDDDDDDDDENDDDDDDDDAISCNSIFVACGAARAWVEHAS